MPLRIFSQDDRVLPDLFQKVRPSVVSVFVADGSGRFITRGTGFAVSRNQIITNYHVVSDNVRLEIETSERKRFRVTRIVGGSRESDIALLEILDLDLMPLTFSAKDVRVGERIIVVGNPFGLSGTLSDGVVSGFRTLSALGKLLQITAPISPGSSGSPVFNLSGEVVGIATLNLPGGQNLNFAIDRQELAKFVPDLRYNASRPKTSDRWRRLISENITYDTETWTLDNGIHSVWIRYNEDDASYSKQFTQINCGTEQIRILRRLSFDREGNGGGETTSIADWRGIVPDSNGESYFKIFCKDQPDYQGLKDWSRKNELIEQGSTLFKNKEYARAEATIPFLI